MITSSSERPSHPVTVDIPTSLLAKTLSVPAIDEPAVARLSTKHEYVIHDLWIFLKIYTSNV